MDKPVARLIKKKRELKSVKLEMKKEKLQPTPQKYQEPYETTMNNCMPIKWKSQDGT